MDFNDRNSGPLSSVPIKACAVNGSAEPHTFTIHADTDQSWNRVIDTSLASPHDILGTDAEIVSHEGNTYRVSQQSVVVLA